MECSQFVHTFKYFDFIQPPPPMRKNTCRKDIRHPRPGCAPSSPGIEPITGKDGAHPETGKKTRAANNILPAARSHYGMKKIISVDFL